jgi:hypothetical protein
MSLQTGDEALIVRYLLDELPADERRLVEHRYFLDDRLFESVCSVEEQLIRDFLRDELPTDQRRRFEVRYLQSPQLSQKVESARLLMESASAASPAREEQVSRPSIWERLRESFRLRAGVLGLAAAGLVTVAIFVAVWFGLNNRRLRTELARSESQRSSIAARPQAEAATPKSNPAGIKAAPLAFLLSPGVTRGDAGGQQRLVIPANGVDRVRLNLEFTPFGQYTTYRVIVSSVSGVELASRDLAGSKLAIDLSAASLPEGDYIIVVKGRAGTPKYEDLDSYYFHVVRRSSPR